MEHLWLPAGLILGVFLKWRDDNLYREQTLEEYLRSLDDE